MKKQLVLGLMFLSLGSVRAPFMGPAINTGLRANDPVVVHLRQNYTQRQLVQQLQDKQKAIKSLRYVNFYLRNDKSALKSFINFMQTQQKNKHLFADADFSNASLLHDFEVAQMVLSDKGLGLGSSVIYLQKAIQLGSLHGKDSDHEGFVEEVWNEL